MQKIDIKPVTKDDYLFLYKLLEERNPVANISHKKLPRWSQHVRFNDAKPYKEDYVIWLKDVRVGRLYITHNSEIGISISKEYQKCGYGTTILKQILKNGGTYLANVAPGNKVSQKFFEKLGFKLVQYTYKYEGIS